MPYFRAFEGKCLKIGSGLTHKNLITQLWTGYTAPQLIIHAYSQLSRVIE